MATLHAFIDDSGNLGDGENVCVLAGYVSSHERWEEFSVAWRAVLDKKPAIEYLKMGHAKAREGQFKGWRASDIDVRLDAMAEVINNHVNVGVICTIPSNAFVKFSRTARDEEMRDPYYFLFRTVLMSVLLHQTGLNIRLPVDFTFDIQSKPAREIDSIYRKLMVTAPDKIREMAIIENPPLMKDDKHVLPLQAADMLAWHTRRAVIRPNDDRAMKIAEKLYSIPILGVVFTEESLGLCFAGANMVLDRLASLPKSQHLQMIQRIRTSLYAQLDSKYTA